MRRTLGTTLLLLGTLAAAATAWRLQDRSGAPAPLPAAPTAAWDLAYARPFRVAEPFTHWWRAERPSVGAGWLIVLTAEPDLLAPRETFEPVLFVGDETAERFNKGGEEGALVAIVPSAPDADGWPSLELSQAPIWFGAGELPERVDAATAAAERRAAEAAGVVPFGAARVAAARAAGGSPLDLADREDLEREAAALVLRYAPSEDDLARGKMLPRER